MPIKGEKITNPLNGDTYEFLETAKDTAGEKVVLKATIKSKGILVPHHYHTLQEENFEVISGELTIWQNGQLHTLKAGESITLPRRLPHNHYNAAELPCQYIHTVSPALDFDFLIETLVGLAADGKSKNGKYGLVQQLVTLKYLDSKSYLANIPIGIQKMLANIVGPLGHAMGYRAVYKQYSGMEK